MPAPQNASLVPFFGLADGMVIRLTALDPTTGAVVAGVVISSVSLDVDSGQGGGEVPIKLDQYLPAFTYGMEV